MYQAIARTATPYIPRDIWSRVLSYTDVGTCFAFHEIGTAQSFLSSQVAVEIALEEVIVRGNLEHLKLLAALKEEQVRNTGTILHLHVQSQTY